MYQIWSLYRFTRYEAMNGGANMQKMGWFAAVTGHSRSSGHGQCHHSIERIGLPIRNYVSIFYRFWDIASYLSKVADFDPPHLHLAPPVILVEFHGDLWHQETRIHGLSCAVVCVILLRLAVLAEVGLVTDRQTATGPWLVPRMHSIAR